MSVKSPLAIAKGLGLDNIEILSVSGTNTNYKLVTFVPEEYTLKLVNALSDAGQIPADAGVRIRRASVWRDGKMESLGRA